MKKDTTPARSRKANTKNPSHRWTETEHKTQAARPVGSDEGPRRGDRRDMNKTYTGNKKHAARGNTPRANVSTRKSGSMTVHIRSSSRKYFVVDD